MSSGDTARELFLAGGVKLALSVPVLLEGNGSLKHDQLSSVKGPVSSSQKDPRSK